MRYQASILQTVDLCVVVIQSEVLVVHSCVLSAVVSVIPVVLMSRRRYWAQRRCHIRLVWGGNNADGPRGIECAPPLTHPRLFDVMFSLGGVRVDNFVAGAVGIGERAQGRLQCTVGVVGAHRTMGGLPRPLRVHLRVLYTKSHGKSSVFK